MCCRQMMTRRNRVSTCHATATKRPSTQAEFKLPNSKNFKILNQFLSFCLCSEQGVQTWLQWLIKPFQPKHFALQRYPYFLPLSVLINPFCIRSADVWNVGGVWKAISWSPMNMERNWVNLINWKKEKRDQRAAPIKPHYESTLEKHWFTL